jgi:nucleoside-diphosphate-sugar epimerase
MNLMRFPAEMVDSLRLHYDGRSVCVTGGAGFIGGHLCDALLSLGASISVLDDLSSSTIEHLSSLIELEPDRIRFVHGSVLDDDALLDAFDGASTIFHLAAIGSVPRSVQHPQRSWSVNATGTVRVLETARKLWNGSRVRLAGTDPRQRIVFAASSSAYGDDPSLPKTESQLPRPLSPYAASKLAGEQLLQSWAASYAMSTVSLRYFNIFGPRQPADSAYAAVIPAFASRLLAGKPPTIYGNGEQTRDFTSVTNAVFATLLAGASSRPLRGEVFNIGAGRRTSLVDLAKVMAERCGVPHIQPEFQPVRTGDVPHSVADVSRASAAIDYRPIASLEEGLDETIQWHRRMLAHGEFTPRF